MFEEIELFFLNNYDENFNFFFKKKFADPRNKTISLVNTTKKSKNEKMKKIRNTFEQREEIEDRIAHIIHDYPNDSSIFKEIIQNADDARFENEKILNFE